MEVCANSLRSAIAAQEGGAKRVEFCDNLAEGGTTPSYGQVALAKRMLTLQVYPIIRPRGGDFLYSAIEFEIMKEDVKIFRSLGCNGIVIGMLNEDGTIDKPRCAELIRLAEGMSVAFHRAFDMTPDLLLALEDVIDLGCERVLTSGGAGSALEGAEVINRLVTAASGRISIMPGAGINVNNIAKIIAETGAKEFHGTAKAFVESEMKYRKGGVNMGAAVDEYRYELTDAETVKDLLELANSAE